jgi:transporter family-2 protein
MGGAGLIWIGAAVGAGFLLALQGPINAELGGTLKAPIVAAFISLSVSAILALGLILISGQPAEWRAPPLWLYLAGGCLGIAIVMAAILVTPKLGAATYLAAAIFGQLAVGLILDHFGLLGLPQHAISFGRVTGVLLVLAGAILMRVF